MAELILSFPLGCGTTGLTCSGLLAADWNESGEPSEPDPFLRPHLGWLFKVGEPVTLPVVSCLVVNSVCDILPGPPTGDISFKLIDSELEPGGLWFKLGACPCEMDLCTVWVPSCPPVSSSSSRPSSSDHSSPLYLNTSLM